MNLHFTCFSRFHTFGFATFNLHWSLPSSRIGADYQRIMWNNRLYPGILATAVIDFPVVNCFCSSPTHGAGNDCISFGLAGRQIGKVCRRCLPYTYVFKPYRKWRHEIGELLIQSEDSLVENASNMYFYFFGIAFVLSQSLFWGLGYRKIPYGPS